MNVLETKKLILLSKHLQESVNNSVEVSGDRNPPSVSDKTTKKLLQEDNSIVIVIDDEIKYQISNFKSQTFEF